MSRSLLFLAAVLLAAPAGAATYAGKPVEPGAGGKVIGRDIVWTYAGGLYQGRTEESRPLVLCQSLAKKAGRLERFTVDGRAFSEAELAKCNAAAPQPSATVSAAAD